MEELSLPTPTKPLVDILEGFNRKERNLLVRDILGHSEQKLRLSGVRPCGWTELSGCFDRLPGVLVFELRGAEIAQRRM